MPEEFISGNGALVGVWFGAGGGERKDQQGKVETSTAARLQLHMLWLS